MCPTTLQVGLVMISMSFLIENPRILWKFFFSFNYKAENYENDIWGVWWTCYNHKIKAKPKREGYFRSFIFLLVAKLKPRENIFLALYLYDSVFSFLISRPNYRIEPTTGRLSNISHLISSNECSGFSALSQNALLPSFSCFKIWLSLWLRLLQVIFAK